MADDVVLVVVDAREEEMVQHAPQSSPHVHRGEMSEEDGEDVEGLGDVQLGTVHVLGEVIQSVGNNEGTISHQKRINSNIFVLFSN